MSNSESFFSDWIIDPPEGAQLHAWAVYNKLKVSPTELARATGIPKSTAWSALRQNSWPRRASQQSMKDRVHQFFKDSGASDEDLATLWFVPRPKPKPAPRSRPKAKNAPLPQEESEAEVLLPKQTLTQHGKKHFKLLTNPYETPVFRDEQFFEGNETAYVREVVWQGATNAGFMALIGESGAGKTTIVADLEERLIKDPRGVILLKPGVLGMEEDNRSGKMLKAADLLHSIVSTLNPSVTVPATMQARTTLAQKLLTTSANMGNSHLLIVEEAHGMPDTTLKHLKRLHELRQGRRSLLGILLVAQPELKKRLHDGLRSGALREVAQRCEVVELLPLDGELRAYLEHRAEAYGRKLDTLIEPEAIEQIRTRLTKKTANGAVSLLYPLCVNNAMTRAMNLAAEIGAPIVTAAVIKAM